MKETLALYRSSAGYEAMQADYEARLSRWPVPWTRQWLQTDAGQTHVIVAGPETGEPLLLLHGWTSNAALNYWEFPYLFERYRVYSPDTPGQSGQSGPAGPGMRGLGYGAWLEDVLVGLEVEQANVVGSSGGGWLAFKLAMQASARLQRLVAIGVPGLSAMRPASFLSVLPASSRVADADLGGFLQTVLSPGVAPHTSPALAEFCQYWALFLRHYRAQSPPAFLPDDELRQVHAPTWILMGQADRVLDTTASLSRARQCIPGLVNATLLEHGSHKMTLDQPDAVREYVLGGLQAPAGQTN